MYVASDGGVHQSADALGARGHTSTVAASGFSLPLAVRKLLSSYRLPSDNNAL